MTRRHLAIGLLVLGAAWLSGCKSDEPAKDSGTTVDSPRGDGGKHDTVGPKTEGLKGEQGKVVKITKILPDNGFASASTQVTIVGEGFAAGMAVYIDGQPLGTAVNVASAASASFTVPKNPYGAPSYDKPQNVDIGVLVGTTSSNQVKFRYTVSVAMEAGFKGSIATTKSDAYRDFASDPVEGKVMAAAFDAGTTPTLQAEVGFGPAGTDPSTSTAWRWSPATFSKTDAGYSLFSGTVTAALEGTYDLAYRFSKVTGYWAYADTDEADLKYDAAKAAKLTVTKAPDGFCMTNTDCVINAFKVTCLVNPSDKSKNQCVECQADTDCTGTPRALGPKCDKTNMICYCDDDPECASNKNGAACLQKPGGYCGCEKDTNCVAPARCYQDEKNQIQVCK